LDIAHTIVDALEREEGEDIILIDIHEIAYFAEYFVICSGTSERMLQALADAAIDQVGIQYDLNGRTEGQPNDGWVLVDFGRSSYTFSTQSGGIITGWKSCGVKAKWFCICSRLYFRFARSNLSE
jgi:ribosome-associated protein